MSSQGARDVLACGLRKVRENHGTVLVSMPKRSMEDIDVLDDEGNVDDSRLAKVLVFEDGRAEIDFRLDE